MVNNGDMISFIKQRDYKMIDNNLGSGSFGKTVLIQDPFIDELFVAKKYEPEFQEIKEAFFNSFLQEIKILYKLNHPNIVRVFNYYPYEKIYTGYIIMEYIEGQSIDEYFSNYIPLISEATPDEVFKQLVSCFQYIENHSIVHRDIRESNILIDKKGIVKIIDFGLGKIFKPIETASDSMVGIINREGLDILPYEYYKGVYDSKTDMFYLGELFYRLINTYGLSDLFSYNDVTKKMMEILPDNRYASFSEIAENLDKKDFSLLKVSRKDKEIYQFFSNAIFSTIKAYTSEKDFNRNINKFEEQLYGVIKDNCFEDYVQNNSSLIKTIVKSSFKYNVRQTVEMDFIKEFYDWFTNLTSKSKQLVLNNIISKLSAIKTEIVEDLPF